ncbi:hypothetical protein A3C09_02640 [Candidatus Uhrbacteria bacterium RIFCSPHIGHO2_02_FULL_47_44]|uniref:Uncharacterized protein n=1 Tax=Candidatus Uhrbacteria bacterium RIFCSPLOWO2_02_FULL_48_18 TaxID=1802408 RepID=A0A1F7V890_9BACT|nr:MAG: hypothetical protein A3C09_02640 [Candidatus Uhrbacteria bacterium RIFCSPHIGHO2_02_FULL_47_44]OGL77106.1 MAG: hypothetical protein A3E97_03385 [Candidatus Uhrbacteria bacterium RIFCSPHIGHO2_12_FULL_47_12]OGL80447.1 MAG: hypothetical protein A3B20_03485 [Candidatus Uhrbacteria bacterium RIFCSPLOWO2_01_FULL_47_17]OGL86307.1 MAG: hypothetical protein A3I41_01965 [Candidatus Uhrbacteria bacterium RIFCSPLOWO2_02_FULL_48_18]OGL94053.1 MAG: hypothetical protein A3H12_00715 [Candidatus Uhrbacte
MIGHGLVSLKSTIENVNVVKKLTIQDILTIFLPLLQGKIFGHYHMSYITGGIMVIDCFVLKLS